MIAFKSFKLISAFARYILILLKIHIYIALIYLAFIYLALNLIKMIKNI